jgi:hypothetical protein
MSGVRRSSRPVLAVLGAIAIFFLAQQLARGTCLFTDVLTPRRIAPFASFAKLAAQLLGSLYAGLCARRYGEESPARPAWIMMSAWLGCWFLGQAVLVTYEVVLHAPTPVPSVGDLFFTLGYGFVIVALFTFASAYRASGFAVGSTRDHALVALGACVIFGAVGYVVLVPVATAPTPLPERVVSVGYPLLDLVTFIPALVLLRITIGFRGGRVWAVWAALLVGILFATGGDFVFADLTPAHVEAIGPLADLLFILGYAFCAYGMRLQYELTAE